MEHENLSQRVQQMTKRTVVGVATRVGERVDYMKEGMRHWKNIALHGAEHIASTSMHIAWKILVALVFYTVLFFVMSPNQNILVLYILILGWFLVFSIYFYNRQAYPEATANFLLDYVPPNPHLVNTSSSVLGPMPSVLHTGLPYDVVLQMSVPECPSNTGAGMFMVGVELLSANGHSIVNSSRPAVLRYKSPLLRRLNTLVWSTPMLFGYTDESQVLTIDLLEHFVDTKETPMAAVKIWLSEPSLQVYSADLTVSTKLHGLRYLMYYWFLSSAVVLISQMTCMQCCLYSIARGAIFLRDYIQEEEEQQPFQRISPLEPALRVREEWDPVAARWIPPTTTSASEETPPILVRRRKEKEEPKKEPISEEDEVSSGLEQEEEEEEENELLEEENIGLRQRK